MKLLATFGFGALCLALVACGEKPQASGSRKADTAPYTTAAGAYTAGGWKQGDATAWDRHMNARAQSGQNEYGRTGPH